MPVPTLDQRICWSLAIRPYARPVLSDHAMFVQFSRYHAGARSVAPAGIVTHPSVVEPDYRTPDRNRGDSLAKLSLTGWFRQGFTVDQLTDEGDPLTAGIVTGRGASQRLATAAVDRYGDRWQLAAIGTGKHHRICADGGDVTHTYADGTTETYRTFPVTRDTANRWWHLIRILGRIGILGASTDMPHTPPKPASLWNAAVGLANVASGRNGWTGADPRDRTAIVGARRNDRPQRPTRARPVADVATEAAALLHQWAKMGIPPRRRGGQSRGQTIARQIAANVPLVGIVGPTIADLPPDIATALRAALDPAPAAN